MKAFMFIIVFLLIFNPFKLYYIIVFLMDNVQNSECPTSSAIATCFIGAILQSWTFFLRNFFFGIGFLMAKIIC